jgi:hypothetical protein
MNILEICSVTASTVLQIIVSTSDRILKRIVM